MARFKPALPRLQRGDPLARGLVGAWEFNEGSGLYVRDHSGYGHDATLVGGPTWGPGRAGHSVYCNGSGQYIDMTPPIADVISNPFSMVLWMRSTDSDISAVFGGMGSTATTYPIAMFQNQRPGSTASGIRFLLRGNSSATYRSTGSSNAVNDGNRHCLVATWDASTLQVFVDGEAQTDTYDTGTPTGYSFSTLSLGVLHRYTLVYYAEIYSDTFRMYDRALGEDEIRQIYVEGG